MCTYAKVVVYGFERLRIIVDGKTKNNDKIWENWKLYKHGY